MDADVFVYLDTVQFSKNGVQNRNQIKTANGPLWLTVPVKQHLGQKLKDIEIADNSATAKHFKTLQANYARTTGFIERRLELEKLLVNEFSLLIDAAVESTEWMLDKLGVQTKRVRASELSEIEGESSQLVSSICRELGASEYLTGTGALAYLEARDFSRLGCQIKVQTWEPFEYEQSHSSIGFLPDLSTLDLLLNCPQTSAQLISSAGGWESYSV